jgi:hypothetical protein
MPSGTIRAELVAEIAELQERQLESTANATFLGWTPEGEAAHRKRAERLSALCLQQEALNADG